MTLNGLFILATISQEVLRLFTGIEFIKLIFIEFTINTLVICLLIMFFKGYIIMPYINLMSISILIMAKVHLVMFGTIFTVCIVSIVLFKIARYISRD